MLAQDASFVPKSGRHTPGLGWFYNGLAGRCEKGLELSLVSVVDLTHNTAYALHARQSLPPKAQAKAQADSACKDVEHLRQTQPYWPAGVRHLAADGAHTRRPFVDGVCALGLEMVGKLRRDANLRYLFQGPQKPRGRRRLYDGKVLWKQFDPGRWNHEGEVEPGVHLYSTCLFHLSLKRVIKVALLRKAASASTDQVLLFSTDLSLSGRQIVRMYRARFQIEFLFRDAKGAVGLTHCQARNEATLHFHWNMAFAALNLAKAQPAPQPAPQPPRGSRPRFSWRSVQPAQRAPARQPALPAPLFVQVRLGLEPHSNPSQLPRTLQLRRYCSLMLSEPLINLHVRREVCSGIFALFVKQSGKGGELGFGG